MSTNYQKNNKQQQQTSNYSSTFKLFLEPLGESALPTEEIEELKSESESEESETLSHLALSSMLKTLNAVRTSTTILPESFSPYASPPPPIFDYSYSQSITGDEMNDAKGKGRDYIDSSNLYFQPRYFGSGSSGSSSGSSTPGSTISYTTTTTTNSSGTTPPYLTTLSSNSNQQKESNPYFSPPRFFSLDFNRIESSVLPPQIEGEEEEIQSSLGLQSNFTGLSPRLHTISSEVNSKTHMRGRSQVVEGQEIEGVSFRIKSLGRDGFVF